MKGIGLLLIIVGLGCGGVLVYGYYIATGTYVGNFPLEGVPISEYRVIGPITFKDTFHKSRLRLDITTKYRGGVYYDVMIGDKSGAEIWSKHGLLNSTKDAKTLFRERLPVFMVDTSGWYYIFYKFTAQARIEYAELRLYSNIGELDRNFLWSTIGLLGIGLIAFIYGVNREIPHRHPRLPDDDLPYGH